MPSFEQDIAENTAAMETLLAAIGGKRPVEISAAVFAQNDYIYTVNNVSRTTLTLPYPATFGKEFEIIGKGAGGWKVAQNAGQTIHMNESSTTTGATGYIQSTHFSDAVRIVCITADTDFRVLSLSGIIDMA